MRSAIDTNVISALWSKEAAMQTMTDLLFSARKRGELVVSAPVYAELLAYPGITDAFVRTFLQETGIRLDFDISQTLWQTAGEAFARYAVLRRKNKLEHPKRLLIDFLVGAHAMQAADRLLTLDKGRYQQAYPSLKIVSSLGDL